MVAPRYLDNAWKQSHPPGSLRNQAQYRNHTSDGDDTAGPAWPNRLTLLLTPEASQIIASASAPDLTPQNLLPSTVRARARMASYIKVNFI